MTIQEKQEHKFIQDQLKKFRWLVDMYKHLAKGGEVEIWDITAGKYILSNGNLTVYSDPAHCRKKPLIEIREIRYPKAEIYEPKMGTEYFTPRLNVEELVYRYVWIGDTRNNTHLSNKLVHLNEEAASEHAKALLGNDEKVQNDR